MSFMIVVGSDKLAGRFLHRLGKPFWKHVLLDASVGVGRVVKLWRRSALSTDDFVRMAWAEWSRPSMPFPGLPKIRTNSDLLEVIVERKVEKLYLFRAGLIISRRVLDTGVDAINTHCARLPDYGGLASISRALADGAYEQRATIHRVTKRIDEGEILAERAYLLDPRRSYRENEDIAYAAGTELLTEWILEHHRPEDG